MTTPITTAMHKFLQKYHTYPKFESNDPFIVWSENQDLCTMALQKWHFTNYKTQISL